MTPSPIHSVTIVGSGNVAEALARALADSPFELRQVWARNEERGREIAALFNDRRTKHPAETACTERAGRRPEAAGNTSDASDLTPEAPGGTSAERTSLHPAEWTSDPAALAPADLYLIAVSDLAVAGIAASLPFPRAAIVVHTAGCVPLDALTAPRRGVLYPLQTFTRGREVDFRDVPLFIEGSDEDVQQALETFARALSDMVLRADGEQRVRIHLAGVLANNFTNHFFACAKGILDQSGFRYEILKPIIRETAAKALAANDPAPGQTGPAVRGDQATQQRHLALLNDDETLKTIYQSISKHIWETSKKI